MSDWLWVLYAASYLAMYVISVIEGRKHRKEIERIHESYKEERDELLDRIMSNNIHEFKSVTSTEPNKKSENGNFLIDRMEKSIQRRLNDL